MKLICIEEHAVDAAIAQAAQPVVQLEAPYLGLQSSRSAACQPGAGDRPSLVELGEAIRLGTDLGKVLEAFHAAGCHRVAAAFTDHGGVLGVLLLAERTGWVSL